MTKKNKIKRQLPRSNTAPNNFNNPQFNPQQFQQQMMNQRAGNTTTNPMMPVVFF